MNIFRLIKLALISIIVFGLMLLIFTLIMPSHVRISRAINIQASSIKTKDALETLKAADNNFVYQWTILPFDSLTAVQLYYDFHIKWYHPFQKLGSIVYDKQIGPVMERYLLQLKKELE